MRGLTIVAVNHRADEDRRRALPDSWVVWPTAAPVGRTYRTLAQVAARARWDQSTVVVQDDVRWTAPPEPHQSAEVVLYGGHRLDTGHSCPRAFAASPTAWEMLAEVWADEPYRLCPGFETVMGETTVMILDQIEHTEPAGKRPWPRRVA